MFKIIKVIPNVKKAAIAQLFVVHPAIPFASNKKNAKTKTTPFERTPMILYTHLFEIIANTIPSMDREPNKTIANVKFAFGPLRMKNAMILSTTIAIDETPNLFKFESPSTILWL